MENIGKRTGMIELSTAEKPSQGTTVGCGFDSIAGVASASDVEKFVTVNADEGDPSVYGRGCRA